MAAVISAASAGDTRSSASTDSTHSLLASDSAKFFCAPNPSNTWCSTRAPRASARETVSSSLPQSTTIRSSQNARESRQSAILAASFRVMTMADSRGTGVLLSAIENGHPIFLAITPRPCAWMSPLVLARSTQRSALVATPAESAHTGEITSIIPGDNDDRQPCHYQDTIDIRAELGVAWGASGGPDERSGRWAVKSRDAIQSASKRCAPERCMA